jgi:hypothetical protein
MVISEQMDDDMLELKKLFMQKYPELVITTLTWKKFINFYKDNREEIDKIMNNHHKLKKYILSFFPISEYSICLDDEGYQRELIKNLLIQILVITILTPLERKRKVPLK